ncbi:endonuclease Q family protein, partial [Patescibacteria group bacterium]
MDLEHLDKWAKIKGIKVVGTGDFTHPEWLSSLKERLEPAEPGLYKLKQNFSSPKPQINSDFQFTDPKEETSFILTAEISCIYSKGGKVRKVHIILFAPSFEVVEKINANLGWIGNLKSDGRPILGLDAKELAKIALEASKNCLVVPAHLWTPWFSVFGSKSGFDSIEECFDEYSKYIYAGETGLSSDPKMNWGLSALDNITL